MKKKTNKKGSICHGGSKRKRKEVSKEKEVSATKQSHESS